MEIKSNFQKSIKNGTGEAILLLKKYPDINFDSDIKHACLHNLAYDPQCEGTRSDYLREILQLSKNSKIIVNNIIEELAVAYDDSWDTYQLIELTKSFAQDGNKQAKSALYERYQNNLNPNYSFIETDALVEIDGFDGLCFSIEILIKYLDENEDFWIDDSLLSCFEERFPAINLKERLQKLADTNNYIRSYLKCEYIVSWFNPDNVESTDKKSKIYTYQEVLNLIRNQKQMPITIGRKVEEETSVKLSKDFEENQNSELDLGYLKFFLIANYSGNISKIIRCLYSENERGAHFSANILSKKESSKIRLLIENSNIEFLKNKMQLLIKNYKETDFELLLKVYEILEGDDEIHSFGLDVIKIFENNKVRSPSRLLNKLYEVINCTLCRESIVEILISEEDITDKILQESLYDCDEDIRTLAKDYCKANDLTFNI